MAVQYIYALAPQHASQVPKIARRHPEAFQVKAAYDPVKFPASLFNGFHVLRLQRGEGNHVRFVPTLGKESHPAQGVNVPSVGEKTDSHSDSAHRSLRLALAQA